MRATVMGLLHTQIWQRLPYGLRRAALFRTASALAPRFAPGAMAGPPFTVVGAFRASSGLGASARLCLEALRATGVKATALDITAALRQPATLPSPEPPSAVEPGPGTLILHVNAPLIGMALLAVGRRRAAGKRIIGYWAWELPEVPSEWTLGVGLVHEIWVPSAFTAAAIAPISRGRPVHVVPHPVALTVAPARLAREAGKHFTVLSLFDASSSLARKNPEGAIAAFYAAFGDDPGVRLVLKTQRMPEAGQAATRLRALADAPNVTILDATFDAAGLETLYAEADVLLSLHRAEGFGLTIAEAMRRGIPVVATGWSGNADFLSSEVGVPVPWSLVSAQDDQRTYHHPNLRWAEPDVTAAAAALRRLRADPALAKRLGAAGAAWAAREWSADAYHARLAAIGTLAARVA